MNTSDDLIMVTPPDTMVIITGIPIVVTHDAEEQCYFARCPHFVDLVRDGSTPEEAIDYFKAAFVVKATSRLVNRTLEAHMREAGYFADMEWTDGMGPGCPPVVIYRSSTYLYDQRAAVGAMFDSNTQVVSSYAQVVTPHFQTMAGAACPAG